MALIQCQFYSQVLNLCTSMTVILPEPSIIGNKSNQFPEKKYQTLYLLHGLSDDDTIWTRRTSIERYVSSLRLAVVMPQVHHSFYTDMKYGNKYWTFLTKELPLLAQSFFPLSTARKDNFVAGLSMGGYGALKWALNHPETFSAAASLSGVTDIVKRKADQPDGIFNLIFGDEELTGTEHDLFALIKKTHECEEKPIIYQCCGTEDFLYEDNLRFKKFCEEANYPLTTKFEQGNHEWGYWDKAIQEVLDWLPLNKGQ
ncbi:MULTISPECIES: alpha/beta hydrolase [Heyndrickxia]|uniref:alpha/beta hydrolase n=1 Tax=Heyndrickxia TaxID=2837504 RepID=UPI0024305E1F|nr:alpha/beta hydrolase family protein [Heyndrickxia oleronia]MCI1589937.1 esterase family protein [Heyndrickxia oleronia]MCI1611648.1 esterase family protein [Heyndrickxia oleronia]MCI1743563.1 esterase family protein [Heyndrickxia oleronia]MCI1760170.1 esterase family protein [Heyndrickxia oleronia]